MYKQLRLKPSKLKGVKAYQGERLEEKINRITNNKEPIKDGAPLIYTERKDGVKAAYDIRTDRFEVAIDAMEAVTKSHRAKREERHKPKEDPKTDPPKTDPPSGGNAETAANT